jgi:hypothetical protein
VGLAKRSQQASVSGCTLLRLISQPGVPRTSSALGNPSHGWLISPSTDAPFQARRSRKSKVERGSLGDLSLLHNQPRNGVEAGEDTSSVGRYGVWFSYPLCAGAQENRTVEPIVPYSSQINLGQAKVCWRNSSKADPIFNLKIAQRLGGSARHCHTEDLCRRNAARFCDGS